jgi:hypothetical protein
VTRCRCKGSGLTRRVGSGDQVGCPKHGHKPLPPARLDLLAAAVEAAAADLAEHGAKRWGCCYGLDGKPNGLEFRNASGRGDFFGVGFTDEGRPTSAVAELLGLLDPVAVRELVRLARLGMAGEAVSRRS